MVTRPSTQAAGVVVRVAQPKRWEDWQFCGIEVLADDGNFGSEPRKMHDDGMGSARTR